MTASIKILSKSSPGEFQFHIVSPDDDDFAPLQRKSQSIPITKGLHRTPSEIQLCEDEALADYRDYCMYTRIVHGIQRSQCQAQDFDLQLENDACLQNIRRTRCGPPEESQSLESRHESLLNVLRNPSLKTTRDYLTQAQAAVTASHDTIFEEDEIFVIDL